jgi:Suppressor of fused protein (SUFU)
MTELIAHLESYLGAISGGTGGDESTPAGLQVVWFGANRPYTGVTTIATLGLSRHHLAQSASRGVHQELLMHLPMAGQPRKAAALLLQVAAELIAQGRGLLRGEVIGPRGPLFGSGQMTALYAAAPGYLAPGFDTCDIGTVTVVMTWLVPITDTEAGYVRTRGWPTFEETLIAEDPDLVDLSRSPVTAARDLGG